MNKIEFNDEIISIEECGEVEMMDIEVTGEHLFYGDDILIHNCAINKDSKEVDNSAISDSLGTAMTADLIVMLVQTERQKENNEITFKITKNRYTGLTREFKAIANYKLMRFEDMLIPQDEVAPQLENKTPQEQAQAFDFSKLLNP
jgi:hypothetical protein